MPRYEMYIEHEHGNGWCKLRKEFVLEDGTNRVVETKLLKGGELLQYARRTGEVGLSAQRYQEGSEPKHGDWREIPEPVTTAFVAQPTKTPKQELPEGIEFK